MSSIFDEADNGSNSSAKKAKVSREEAMGCVRKLLEYIGDDPDREGLQETPARVVDSFLELYSGYSLEPSSILGGQLDWRSKQMIVLANINFSSVCEHHMLPFKGLCHIGYLPGSKIVGIGKLAQLVEVFSRRLQIQENMTFSIAKTLMDTLKPTGAAVVIEASHTCMTCRGASKAKTVLSTSVYLGDFDTRPELRQEFLSHCRHLA